MHCQFLQLLSYDSKIDIAVNKIGIPYRGILNAQINIFVNQLQLRNSTNTYLIFKLSNINQSHIYVCMHVHTCVMYVYQSSK